MFHGRPPPCLPPHLAELSDHQLKLAVNYIVTQRLIDESTVVAGPHTVGAVLREYNRRGLGPTRIRIRDPAASASTAPHAGG